MTFWQSPRLTNRNRPCLSERTLGGVAVAHLYGVILLICRCSAAVFVEKYPRLTSFKIAFGFGADIGFLVAFIAFVADVGNKKNQLVNA